MTNFIFRVKFKYFKIIVILLILFAIIFLYNDNRDERIFFDKYYVLLGGSLSEDNVCHLPINVNPFDESVAKFIKVLPKKIECKYQSDLKNNLTFIDDSGVLRQTLTYFKCKYQFLHRIQENDNQIVYKKLQDLDPKNGVSMADNSFVSVQCEDMTGSKVYENTHYWFPLTQNQDLNERSDKPSVLVLVIESLSRINYLRFMPQTRHSFEKLGKIVYMKGLTKLADNSFPNMVPFLTGRRVYKQELQNEDFGPYDDWPFVWKEFSRAGYKTTLIEDFPTFTLFNYESKGFQTQPTDWYPRPFWIHLFRDISKILLGLVPFELSHCYIDRFPKIDIFLQQIKHFIHQCVSNRFPYFAFTFYIEVTHNDFNRAQLIDSHLSQFVEQSKHLFNNTVLILMGDHGNRFGSVLQTVIGKIEERMPLFAIRVPEQLNNKFPNLLPTLESNSDKLMTWLDLHHILIDIANHNYSEMVSEAEEVQTYSPWRQTIPESRTCLNALIPDNYCVCDKRKILNVSEPIVRIASFALIKQINLFVPKDKCQELRLKSLLSAELILPSSSTAKPKGFESRIEVTLSAEPSSAIFRGQLVRTARSQDWALRGEVNRINKYGNQSHCVRERQLKPFCYCLGLSRLGSE